MAIPVSSLISQEPEGSTAAEGPVKPGSAFVDENEGAPRKNVFNKKIAAVRPEPALEKLLARFLLLSSVELWPPAESTTKG